MSQALVNLIGEAVWDSVGGLSELLGFVVLGILFYFLIRYKVDRGGLALVGVLVLGFMARETIYSGFGLIPVWIFYVVLVACAILAGRGFIEIQGR